MSHVNIYHKKKKNLKAKTRKQNPSNKYSGIFKGQYSPHYVFQVSFYHHKTNSSIGGLQSNFQTEINACRDTTDLLLPDKLGELLVIQIDFRVLLRMPEKANVSLMMKMIVEGKKSLQCC